MKLDCLQVSPQWAQPIFKVLAHNDTGAAVGHQAGVLIPKSIRPYFPPLNGVASSLQPTIDTRINASLFVEDKFVGEVCTRYQYQTWSGERSPEARITDELGAMRNAAEAGDILIFQRAKDNNFSYRLTLVRRSSSIYPFVAAKTGAKRWGVLK